MSSGSNLQVPDTREADARPIYEAKIKAWDAYWAHQKAPADAPMDERIASEIEHDRLLKIYQAALVSVMRLTGELPSEQVAA